MSANMIQSELKNRGALHTLINHFLAFMNWAEWRGERCSLAQRAVASNAVALRIRDERSSQPLSRPRERLGLSVLQEQRLELVRHRRVIDWGITVSLDVFFQSLMGCTPDRNARGIAV